MLPATSNPDTEALQRETIGYWVEVAISLGFTRSIGETYGIVFLSNEPLNADDIVEKSGNSRSGVGQALKVLLEIGAIRPARQPQSRKDHYEPQTDLGVLVRLFLSSRVFPRVEELGRRRTSLATQAHLQGIEHLTSRFEKLDRWGDKTKPLLTLLKMLGG